MLLIHIPVDDKEPDYLKQKPYQKQGYHYRRINVRTCTVFTAYPPLNVPLPLEVIVPPLDTLPKAIELLDPVARAPPCSISFKNRTALPAVPCTSRTAPGLQIQYPHCLLLSSLHWEQQL